MAAHAHGAEGAKRAVRAGVRSIEHGSLLDDEALDLMGEHGTWLVADVYNGDYIEETGVRDGWPEELLRKNRETTGTQREAFTKAVERGLNIAFGTDAGVYPHGENARQLPIMVRLGLDSARDPAGGHPRRGALHGVGAGRRDAGAGALRRPGRGPRLRARRPLGAAASPPW